MGKQLNTGDRYGYLTILGDAPRGKHGERRYFCRCDCGNTGSFSVQNIIRNPEHRCSKCSPHKGGKPKPDLVGKQINGWDILDVSDYKGNGLSYFKCRCLRCGNEAMRNAAQIRAKKTNRCDQCPPMYHFRIDGNTAIGVLPNGDTFIIDVDTIPLVETFFWNYEKNDGYIIETRKGIRLHRLVAGVEDPKIMVDHINRNRKDCRRENLRVISPFGNSANHSLFQTNKTGYTGVYYSKCSCRYEVKVGYKGKRILLGSSKHDLVTLAQMYNIGACFFFGEYAGSLNNVPDPTNDLVKRVIAKCQKYIEPPANADAPAA